MTDSANKNNSDIQADVTGSVLITHDVGLHARPSVTLTKMAKRFESEISISLSPEGPWVNAKSISKVMKMKAPQNAVLYFNVAGADAAEAIKKLISLVENDFLIQ